MNTNLIQQTYFLQLSSMLFIRSSPQNIFEMHALIETINKGNTSHNIQQTLDLTCSERKCAETEFKEYELNL